SYATSKMASASGKPNRLHAKTAKKVILLRQTNAPAVVPQQIFEFDRSIFQDGLENQPPSFRDAVAVPFASLPKNQYHAGTGS
ncbi:MAG TPA: hypothetical protein VHP35_05995, partial [Terriglobia bacterium]|nr:hypothetical protein [Terriglobia bacterium]